LATYITIIFVSKGNQAPIPMTSIYNAGAVNFYSATGSLAHFES
jgi:hypothetical protein